MRGNRTAGLGAGLLLWLALLGAAAAFPQLALRPGGTPFEGPTDAEVTSLWWNPAAIGSMRGLHLHLSGQLLVNQGSVQRASICSMTGLPGDCGDRSFPSAPIDNSGRNLGWGGMAGVTWDFRQENLTIGFGVMMPWEQHRTFSGADTAAAGSGGLPTAYQLRSEDFRTLYFAIALAVKLSQKLSIGAGVSVIDTWASMSFDHDTALDRGSAGVGSAGGFESPTAAARIRVSGDGGSFWRLVPSPSGLAISVGAVVQPVGWLYLGASWSKAFPFNGDNGRFQSARAVDSSVVAAAGQCATYGGTCPGGAAITYDIPDVWHLGARMLLPHDVELSAWGRVVVYGPYNRSNPTDEAIVIQLSGPAGESAGVPSRIVLARGLQPAVAGELGVRWRPLRPLRLGLSFIAESSSVAQPYLSAAALDGPKLDGMAAGELRLGWFRLMVGYELTGFVLGTVNPGAYSPAYTTGCANNDHSLPSCGDALAGRGQPSNAGTYSLLSHRFSLALGVDY